MRLRNTYRENGFKRRRTVGQKQGLPYVYCLNNPVRFVDIDGRFPRTFDTWVARTMNKVNDIVSRVQNGESLAGAIAKSTAADVVEVLTYTDVNDLVVLGSTILSAFTDITPVNIDMTPASAADIDAARAGLLLPAISGSAVVKTEKAVVKAISESTNTAGRAGKTIVKENGVVIKSYGTGDAHKPAHAHVEGGGQKVRIGPNGKPLKGEAELSTKQSKVVNNNVKSIRNEVNKVGKENKRIEDELKRQN